MSICLHIKITLVLEVGICRYIFFPLQYNIVSWNRFLVCFTYSYNLFVYFRLLEFHLDLNRRNPSDSVSGSLRFMAKSERDYQGNIFMILNYFDAPSSMPI